LESPATVDPHELVAVTTQRMFSQLLAAVTV